MHFPFPFAKSTAPESVINPQPSYHRSVKALEVFIPSTITAYSAPSALQG